MKRYTKDKESYATRHDPQTALTAIFIRRIVEKVTGEFSNNNKNSNFITEVINSRFLSGSPSLAVREKVLSCSPQMWSAKERCTGLFVSKEAQLKTEAVLKRADSIFNITFKKIWGNEEGPYYDGGKCVWACKYSSSIKFLRVSMKKICG